MSNKRTFAVLGGAGFLGSAMCNKLKSEGFDVVVFDKSFGCDLSTEIGQNKLKSFLQNNVDCNDVIMMAARLGAKLFDTDPFEPFIENASIDYKTFNTFKDVRRKLHITYYSTSEVYGNVALSTDYSLQRLPTVDPSYSRSLYAQEKLMFETMLNHGKSIGMFSSLRIMRPFNVSGIGQRRGVMYEMVKSAWNENIIRYAPNQSREITFLDDATDIAANLAISHKEGAFDLTSKFHIMLEDLAYCVKTAFEKTYHSRGTIDVVDMPIIDTYIKHRGTSPLIITEEELNQFIGELIRHHVVEDIVTTMLN